MPRISEGEECGRENICVEGWSGVSVLSVGASSWQLNAVGAFDFQGAMYRFMTRVNNVRKWHSGRHGCVDCTRTKTICFCMGEYFKSGSLKSVEIHQLKKSVEKSILI